MTILGVVPIKNCSEQCILTNLPLSKKDSNNRTSVENVNAILYRSQIISCSSTKRPSRAQVVPHLIQGQALASFFFLNCAIICRAYSEVTLILSKHCTSSSFLSSLLSCLSGSTYPTGGANSTWWKIVEQCYN